MSLPIICLIFVAPFAIGAALIIAGLGSRLKWARWAACITGSLFILFFLVAVIGFAPYMWASHLESKWYPAHPRTKTELEAFLSLYSQRDIQPSESDWGRNHQLQSGERMTQYLLLWNAPLDVVYTSDDTIVAIYTSYE